MWEYRVQADDRVMMICAQTNDDFVRRAAERGIQVLTSESFTGDPRQQVRNLKVSIPSFD